MELVAYSPFGSNGNAVSKQHKSALKHPLIVKCAKELSCTPAQVVKFLKQFNYNRIVNVIVIFYISPYTRIYL